MSKKVFIFTSLFCLSLSLMFSTVPNDYESYCLQVMANIELELKANLSEEYQIIETHVSSVGQIFNDQTFIRDCIIEKNEKAVSYIFLYPATNKAISKEKSFKLISNLAGVSGKKLNIALFCEDKELKEKIQKIVSKMDFKGIVPQRLE